MKTTVLFASVFMALKLLAGSMLSTGCADDDLQVRFRLSGAVAGYEMSRAATKAFHEQHERTASAYEVAESRLVPHFLLSNQSDIGIVLASQVPSLKRYLNKTYRPFILGQFVVQVVVNRHNPIRQISTEQLSAIYEGKLVAWKQLGSNAIPGPIKAYAPNLAEVESHIFQHRLMGGRKFGGPLMEQSTASTFQKESTSAVLGMVLKDPNAIGFCIWSQHEPLSRNLRVLRIVSAPGTEGIEPTLNTVANGTYPLVDTLSLYLHPDAPPLAEEFCRFATEQAGASIIEKYRIIPQYHIQQTLAATRLEQLKAGEGVPISFVGTTGTESIVKQLGLTYSQSNDLVQVRHRKKSLVSIAAKDFQSGGAERYRRVLSVKVPEWVGRAWLG